MTLQYDATNMPSGPLTLRTPSDNSEAKQAKIKIILIGRKRSRT